MGNYTPIIVRVNIDERTTSGGKKSANIDVSRTVRVWRTAMPIRDSPTVTAVCRPSSQSDRHSDRRDLLLHCHPCHADAVALVPPGSRRRRRLSLGSRR